MTAAPQFQKYLDNDYNNLEVELDTLEISPPPKDSSHSTRMELEELERIIEEAKLPLSIMRVADRDPLRLFYSVAKKKNIDPLEEEAKRWADDWTKLSFEYKLKFKRRRPYEVKKEHDIDFIVDKSDTSESPSYPSGHALMAYGVAEFYKEKYPLMSEEWDNIADIIAHSRLQMGVHYPSDVRASKSIVSQLVKKGTKLAEWYKEAGKSTAYKALDTASRKLFKQWVTKNRGGTVKQWQATLPKPQVVQPPSAGNRALNYASNNKLKVGGGVAVAGGAIYGGNRMLSGPKQPPMQGPAQPNLYKAAGAISVKDLKNRLFGYAKKEPVKAVSKSRRAAMLLEDLEGYIQDHAIFSKLSSDSTIPTISEQEWAKEEHSNTKLPRWFRESAMQEALLDELGFSEDTKPTIKKNYDPYLKGTNAYYNPALHEVHYDTGEWTPGVLAHELGHSTMEISPGAKSLNIGKDLARVSALPLAIAASAYGVSPTSPTLVNALRARGGISNKLKYLAEGAKGRGGRWAMGAATLAGLGTLVEEARASSSGKDGIDRLVTDGILSEEQGNMAKDTMSGAFDTYIKAAPINFAGGVLGTSALAAGARSLLPNKARLGIAAGLGALGAGGVLAGHLGGYRDITDSPLFGKVNLLDNPLHTYQSSKTAKMKFASPTHLEQRRSERAKFMSKEELGSLEKKVRRAKDLPEGAHYITLPHGRKGVVRTEEGKSHLATILDARMRPPGRDISSKVKTAAEKLRLYHGSPLDLETLEPRQPNKGRWGDQGLYGTPNPLVAALYAIARNDSRGSWGVLPDGRLIARSKKELNPEGYVYEYDSDDYITPPEDDPGIGYATQSSPGILSKKKVYLDKLRDSITRVDDRDKFLEYFKKTSAYKDYRPRGTLYLLDGKGGVMADKPTESYGSIAPYHFPGGGIFEEEKVDRLPTSSEIAEGIEREALEELGTKLKNVRILQDNPVNIDMPDWWRERQKKKRGLDYKGIAEFYAAAERGELDKSIYGADNDEFKGTFYPIEEVASAIEGSVKPGDEHYDVSTGQARLLRSLLEKTSAAQPLLRHRSTLLIRDPDTGKLLAAKEPPNSKASPFYFPGGGLYEDEYDTPRNPSNEDIIEGARREALEELGIELDNPRVVGTFGQELEGWWKEKTLKNRGVPYVGGHEHYVLADRGKEDRSLYNVEGDAFEQGDYYDPAEIVEALSRAAKGDSAFAPFNREQVRAIKDNLLKKNASDLSVLTAVPTQNLDLIMRKGLYSQKAMLDDPEVMAAFLAQRNADKAWKNDEQYDEKRFREQYDKRLKLMEGDDAALAGPSVFFTEPDPDKVSDPRHFINKFDTQKLRLNLAKLLQDIPETRIQGAELIPFPTNAMSMSDEEWDEIAKQRRRDLTSEEVEKYTTTDPKELWKDYGEEHIGRYYAANVPHAFIRTPSGIIPPEYLEQVEKTSSAKEQLKHILKKKAALEDKLKSAVIIKGNPYYLEEGPDVENYANYYKEIEDELRKAGYGDITYDRGDDNTTPRNADLWVGHSRGSGRLRFAPKGTKTLDVTQYEDGIEEYKAMLLKEMVEKGYSSMREFPVEERTRPGSEHYTVTERMREAIQKTASEQDFAPDFTPDDLKALGVYDQVYGDAPSEASMKEWPEHWINKQDPLGWLQWYDRYSGGRRTDDDERQMKRWKSFKARHLAQYLKKPTPRRAAALRNWGIDVEKY